MCPELPATLQKRPIDAQWLRHEELNAQSDSDNFFCTYRLAYTFEPLHPCPCDSSVLRIHQAFSNHILKTQRLPPPNVVSGAGGR